MTNKARIQVLKSGQEILDHFELKPFQVVEFVRKGLKPCDSLGREIDLHDIDIIVYWFIRELEEDRECIAAGVIQPPDPLLSVPQAIDLIEEKIKELRIYSGSLNEEGWERFKLPDNPNLAEQILSKLVNANYSFEAARGLFASLTAPSVDIKPKKLRINQQARDDARAAARESWLKEPTATLPKIVGELRADSEFGGYSEKTLGNWVRDVNPNYTPNKPGRKRKARSTLPNQ